MRIAYAVNPDARLSWGGLPAPGRDLSSVRPDACHLMVNLLIDPDRDTISGEGQVINILDPACGTTGMLTAAEDKIKSFNPSVRVYLWGQEFNPWLGATGSSEMLLRDQPGSIFFGNSFSNDGYAVRTDDGPPNQVRLYAGQLRRSASSGRQSNGTSTTKRSALGYAGRFGAGLPRINDGSFLFLQHMISKMEPVEGKGCRLAIVFNGSPLFTGAADSGESNIRSGSWRTTGWKGSSRCRTQLFSTTQGSPRTSGSSRTPDIEPTAWVIEAG